MLRRVVFLLPFLHLACVEKPDGPPPLPTRANTMDTAGGAAEVAVDYGDDRNNPPKFTFVKCTGATDGETAARVEYGVSDPEDGRVKVRIDWYVNDKRVPEQTSDSLPARFFVRGDKVLARLEASDGQNEITRDCDPAVVDNHTPVIDTRHMDLSQLDGLQVEGSDPDGDPITWSIEDGPPGMTIDADGVLHWDGSPDAEAGTFKPRVIAEDPSGERATWKFTVDVTPAEKPPGED